jgi:DNA-binding NtrC family response regulator
MDDSSVPIRVLLVDDEEEFLASVTKPLGRRGFEITTAPDGSRALELIGTRKFDVVVLDVKMPGLSGDQVFREIKKLRPGLPVIMLTGHGTIQQAFQTSKEGVFEYLAKPCDVEALTEVLRRATHDIRSRGADDPALSESERVRVMLVDDEEDLLESLSKALVRRGMLVETAPDGEKALGKAEGNVFDVVVLDMKMPGMGGMATLLRFKENYPLTEVILLTGHPSSPQAVEAMRRGAFDFLMKPVDIAELVRCIHEAAAKRAGRVNEERARRIEELSRRSPG